MDIDAQTPDAAILAELGSRIRAVRLAMNLSQEQVAEEAGIGRVTLQRLERGSTGSSLRSLIGVLRVLGLSEGLDVLVPARGPSPLQQLEAAGRTRRRADHRSSPRPEAPAPGAWRWGDEEDEAK